MRSAEGLLKILQNHILDCEFAVDSALGYVPKEFLLFCFRVIPAFGAYRVTPAIVAPHSSYDDGAKRQNLEYHTHLLSRINERWAFLRKIDPTIR